MSIADSRECSELNASSPVLNQGPLDLQSNALPTELSRLDEETVLKIKYKPFTIQI